MGSAFPHAKRTTNLPNPALAVPKEILMVTGAKPNRLLAANATSLKTAQKRAQSVLETLLLIK